MDRIYMTCIDCLEKTKEAKIAVFMKGTSDHVESGSGLDIRHTETQPPDDEFSLIRPELAPRAPKG